VPKAKRKIHKLDQKGQTFIEFVLLIVMTMVMSLLMLKTVNTNLADYWYALAKKIVDDPTQRFELK
jgi:Flp pilus assembly pilin Flp